MSEEAAHYLGPYLETTLPDLGLDYETYGPYITGLFPLDNSDGRDNISSSSDVADIEGMDDIIELLQSSSETHGDDDNAWIAFKKEIIQRKNDYEFNESVRQQGEALSRQKIAEEKARNALLNAKEEDEKTYNKKIEQQSKTNQHQRHLNAALIEQYGYENDESTTTTDNKKSTNDNDIPINDNRQNAHELEKARTANVRYEANKSHQSKQSAREATNKMKADKLKAKEDRRKRTMKGERRRG